MFVFSICCALNSMLRFVHWFIDYPTLKFYAENNSESDDFVKFINEKCGTSWGGEGDLISEVSGDSSTSTLSYFFC